VSEKMIILLLQLKITIMKKLGKRNYELIGDSMRTLGFNEPSDGLMNEERMYCNEIDEIVAFLEWLYKSKRSFGRANYEQRFAEFKKECNFSPKPKNLNEKPGLTLVDVPFLKPRKI